MASSTCISQPRDGSVETHLHSMGPCAWRLDDFQRVNVSTMSSSVFFAYGALLTLASWTVYVGSLASLRTPESTKALRKEKGLKETDDDE